MPKLAQLSFSAGEVSPHVGERTDLARYAIALATCSNFFVRPTGGASNRAGTEFVYALNPASNAALLPFVFSITQSYMLVFQQGVAQVYSNGSFVENLTTKTITNVTVTGFPYVRTITTSVAHGYVVSQSVTITVVIATGDYLVNGTFTVLSTPTANTFTIKTGIGAGGSYTSGGTITSATLIATPYQSADLAELRYTQSADVLTVCHQLYAQYEFIRVGATTFTFAPITDFEDGPFLDDNVSATTMTASAPTGSGITITASASVFTPDMVGSLLRLTIDDLSPIPPWEQGKAVLLNDQRLSNGKVYDALNAGTTGTVPPSHDKGSQFDGAAAVEWGYLHSLFGIARITAQAGTTATADVLSYLPVVSPIVTETWALGAWSEDQGYPALVVYHQDRLVFANTPEQPQTEWASKTGDYHNFGKSSPLVTNDSLTQRLNARQINAIVELVPMDQLLSLTASSSWASPKRGEAWGPLTIGFDPQESEGAANLRSIMTGDEAIYATVYNTRVRTLSFGNTGDKFSGFELSALSRHLFGPTKTIVDMDYAKLPDGILWVVLSDGTLAALTYLKEQQVIGWSRQNTDGFFERVCVIPENNRDVPYFIVRRTVGGATVRYLERLSDRDAADANVLDSFFVDSGLTYDGRNTTATTITISGSTYNGGDSVTLQSSAAIFAPTDVSNDAIQFPSAVGSVRALITAYGSSTSVTATLQSPVNVSLQNTPTTTWTFARNTFSGLSHLEGKTVAILADGSPEVPQVVTGGVVTLAYPAGVVHVGLPYVSDIETLNVTIFGASESIRDQAKVIPKVAVSVLKTLGLKAGPDASNLTDCGLQPTNFDYTAPWPLQSEVQPTYVTSLWNTNGKILVRQDQPLPATILAIIPTVEIGGNG